MQSAGLGVVIGTGKPECEIVEVISTDELPTPPPTDDDDE